MRLTLTERRDEIADVHTWVWGASEPISWQAGQYIHYTLPHDNPDDRGIERWFTIAAAPFTGEIRITTRYNQERSSSFKRRLMEMHPGDEIEADAPEGDFVVENPDEPMVFIAGGIGVTPYYAILKQLDHGGKVGNITLLYSNRDDQVLYRDELDQLSAKYPSLKIKYITSPERVDEEMIKNLPDWRNQIYFVSGPEPMVEALSKTLTEMGLPEDKIKGDYFPNYVWPLS